MSYSAIAILMVGVVYLLVEIASRIDFSFCEKEVPALKHFIFIISGWLCLAIINIAVVLNETYSYGLTLSIGVFFKTLLWVMIIITIFWLLALLFQVFKYISEVFK
jgi:hypothetical protein